MIEFTSIITNGYIDSATLLAYMEKGWTFVTTLPAYQVHPYALPTDKITIFSKYSSPDLQSNEESIQAISVNSLREDISILEQRTYEKIHGVYIMPVSQETRQEESVIVKTLR